LVRQKHPYGQCLESPVFRDMKKIVPLQGADIVAYELFKECERRSYRPNDDPRWAWSELLKISALSANFLAFIVHDNETLEMHVKNAERERERLTG
jgi:hypothetical protein